MTAKQLAYEAHAGHVEPLTGRPYIEHVERVVALVEGKEAKAVAYLHDVLEDTAMTEAALEAAGIPAPMIAAVKLLTRGTETYAEYIETIRARRDALALAVKIADLKDHLRAETETLLAESMRRRYERALARLERMPKRFLPVPSGYGRFPIT